MKFATIQTLKGPIIRHAPKNLVVKDSESNPIKNLINWHMFIFRKQSQDIDDKYYKSLVFLIKSKY